MDNMDGHVHENNLELAPTTFIENANYAPHLAEESLYQQDVAKAEENDSQYVQQWIECQQMAPQYVEYLAENGIPGIQGETSYNNTGIGCSFKPDEFLNVGADQVLFPSLQLKEVSLNNSLSTQYMMQGVDKVHHKAAQHRRKVSASTSGGQTKPRSNYARQKSYATDRIRRTRIATAVDALEELLPQPKEGSKSDVLDDVRDYIEQLQLQLKELSQNRLGGESTSNPFVFIEGCGRFLVHEKMASQTLEEMMGKLLETNPSGATKLLESRGLFMMPVAPM